MRRKLTTWLAPAIALTLLGGACDGERPREDPRSHEAFEEALAALAEYDGVRLTVTLDSTPEDLARLDEGEQTLGHDVAASILDSSLVLVSKETTPEDAEAEVVVNVGGDEDTVELRLVEGSLFVRADARAFAATFGGDPSGLPARLGLLGPALEGEWLGIAGVDRVAEQLGGAHVPPPADPRTVAERLAATLGDGAIVTSEGTDGPGLHLSVRLSARRTARGFIDLLRQLGTPLTTAAPLPDAFGLPDGDVYFDAWVDDGRLVQLGIDFLDMGELVGEKPPDDVDRFGLRMRLEEFTSDLEAPRDAVMVDPGRVLDSILR